MHELCVFELTVKPASTPRRNCILCIYREIDVDRYRDTVRLSSHILNLYLKPL